MIDGWITRAADTFWAQVGVRPSFPRDLSLVITRTFPLIVIKLPSLSIQTIEKWFAHRSIPYQFLCQDRLLCGCIVAARGQGVLFIDAADRPSEQRFTIAHELAHFLLDYLGPRQEAFQTFGPAILPVLDGERLPSRTERIDAMLSRVPFGIYTQFMGRGDDGSIERGDILRSEFRADWLALELLAPADEVRTQVSPAISIFDQARLTTDLLTQSYGLPVAVARLYASVLTREQPKGATARWLGL